MSARKDWWYSADDRIGFNWKAVVGYDWHPANGSTALNDSIYVYTSGGILRIGGGDAAAVYEQLKAKGAKSL